MAHGSGLDSQLGIGSEGTWGTRAVPDTFLPFNSESLVLTPSYTESEPIKSGLMVKPQGLHKRTGRSVEGSIGLDLLDRSMGKLLNMLHGNTVTPTLVGTTDANQFVHEIGESSPVGKGLTIQVGRGDVGGTVRPFDYIGCKITQAVITIEQGGLATVEFTIDGKDEVTDEDLASPTYPDAEPFVFENWAIDIAGGAAVNVLSTTITIPLNMKTDRYVLGSSGTKREQLVNAYSAATVAAELEFQGMADHARFTADAPVALEATATGSEIEAGFDYSLAIAVPAAKQISSGPVVDGHDVVTQSVEFEVLSNGADAPIAITQVTDDTAL